MQELLKSIPKMDVLLSNEKLQGLYNVADIAREQLSHLREQILNGKLHSLPPVSTLVEQVLEIYRKQSTASLRSVINATGIIVHTNLGRSCLSESAAQAVYDISKSYSTLEYDIDHKCRGSRLAHIEQQILKLTGAEDVAVVNNNASAVYLMLSALVKNTEVVVSRGELVEIGGSFRIPDIMAESGAILKEVGTTNKTHPYDYERAINENTGGLLAVHTSNYRVIGFTESLDRAELVNIARKHNVLALEDLGSGAVHSLAEYGLYDEPCVMQSLKAGMDVIAISGDKLLGGPQAGILLGKKEYIQKIKKHPMMRALRCDKMTLAALYATLQEYNQGTQLQNIPTLRMLSEDASCVLKRAKDLRAKCNGNVEIIETQAKVGGGSAPESIIKSYAITIPNINAESLENHLRNWELPIIARITNDMLIIDLKTVFEQDIDIIAAALNAAMENMYE